MNWAWANALDQMWRSPAFPTWLTLAAAGFFGVICIITLLRAEKSVANGALTVIALIAVGIAATATTRDFGSGNAVAKDDGAALPAAAAAPALSCVDDLAGEVVLAACEKALFGSAESAAAALSYAARQITRLTTLGDFSVAKKDATPELAALRRAIEHDRYGLMAQVLMVRDHCSPSNCAAFASLADRRRIVANMEERTYDALIARYSTAWNVPAAAPAPVTALVPGVPTGKPTNAEFPSAASTPPVSIMTAEPGNASASTPRPGSPSAAAPTPSPRPAAAPAPALASAKKPPAPKPPPAAPVSIAPAAAAPASNE